MDQNNNNSQNEFLWTLLANPADDAHSYANNLQQLVNDFPQSGILQALLAHAGDEKNLRQASVYFNAKLLYKLVNAPSTINSVPDEKIIIHAPVIINGHYQQIEHPQTDESLVAGEGVQNEEPAEAGIGNNIEETPHPALSKGEGSEEGILSITDQEVLSFGEDLGEATPPVAEEITDHEPEIEREEDQLSNAPLTDEHHLTETVDEETSYPALSKGEGSEEGTLSESDQEALSFVQETPFGGEDLGEATPLAAGDTVVESIEQQPEAHTADDEILDEIVSIEDINIANETIQPAPSVKEEETITDEKQGPETVEDEHLIKENIAPTDQQNVSKYNDEKMPYTFMWWLDKTRKEHTGVYQPYINSSSVNSNIKTKMAADELQQQYFENIFHITSIEELDKGAASRTVPFDMKRKEDVIIERFIKEEPQIKPQSSDKLDNENKAKKSSEDRDELVTETLAGIYSEQMLYHKAIASYKKLILKFPEKSRYFAAKIEQLEKKIN